MYVLLRQSVYPVIALFDPLSIPGRRIIDDGQWLNLSLWPTRPAKKVFQWAAKKLQDELHYGGNFAS